MSTAEEDTVLEVNESVPASLQAVASAFIDAYDEDKAAKSKAKDEAATLATVTDLLIETFAEEQVERISLRGRTLSPGVSIKTSVAAADRTALKKVCDELSLEGVVADAVVVTKLKSYVSEWIKSPSLDEMTLPKEVVDANGHSDAFELDIREWLEDGAETTEVPFGLQSLANASEAVQQWIDDELKGIPAPVRSLVSVFQKGKINNSKSGK